MEIVEIWKDCKGYEGNYQISNTGRLFNVRTQHYIKFSNHKNGYKVANLTAKNGKRKKEYQHRLVALAFIDNPNNYPEVNHINAIRDDNRVENLEWVSRQENIAKSSIFTPVLQYDLDGNLIKGYPSIRDAARSVVASESNISACLGGNQKTCGGFIWKRSDKTHL